MIFTWFAIEIVWCDHIFVFWSNSLSIPPGTKVYLTGSITVQESFLMLDANNTRVLGGEVEKLKEKWELNKVRTFHMLLFRGVLFWSCFKLVLIWGCMPLIASLPWVNPLTPKISLVILLSVYHTVLVVLVWRIWYWIN